MIVPKQPLVALFGDPNVSDLIRRVPVIYLNEDGDPFILNDELHPLVPPLLDARQSPNFLGVEIDLNNVKSVIAAAPGWYELRWYYASDDKEIGAYVQPVIAWGLLDDGTLAPMTQSGVINEDSDQHVEIVDPNESLSEADQLRRARAAAARVEKQREPATNTAT